MKSDHLNQYRPWQGRQDQEAQVASHLEEGNHPERGLHRLHLRVLRQQHVLNSRLTVVQRAVPRHVVPATEGVLCGETV